MTTKIKPMNGRVLLREITRERKSPGGLIISASAQDKQPEAEVVATCADELSKFGLEGDSLGLKEGDRVFFEPGKAQRVKIDEVPYLIVKHSDITLKIEE